MGAPRPGGPKAPVKGSFNKESPKDKLHMEAAEFAQNFNIPEAVAFQIVRGDFTLKEWLDKHNEAERKRSERAKVLLVKKQQRGRDEGMAQQYFLKQKKNKTRLFFHMADGSRTEGIVTSILPYHFWVEPSTPNPDGSRNKVEKLQIMYCYKRENEPDVVPAMRHDETVASLELKPVREKEHRYNVPKDLLDKAAQSGKPIRVVLIDGSIFVGTIDWYSHYFIKAKVSPGGSVVVFNHAITNLTMAEMAGARSR